MYKLEYSSKYAKQLQKLDKQTQIMITLWLDKHINYSPFPLLHGKAFTGDKKGLWRYHVGNYRIICHIKDDKLIVLALEVGHRKQVYNLKTYLTYLFYNIHIKHKTQNKSLIPQKFG